MRGTEGMMVTKEEGQIILRVTRLVDKPVSPADLPTLWDPEREEVKLEHLLQQAEHRNGKQLRSLIEAAISIGNAKLCLFLHNYTTEAPLRPETCSAFLRWNAANPRLPLVVEEVDRGGTYREVDLSQLAGG